MGNSITKKYKYLGQRLQSTKRYLCCSRKPKHKLLMVSLDACGKTTLLYLLAQGIVICSVPSIGFNQQVVEFQKSSLQIWQVGGGDKIRQLWKHYLDGVAAILYVIDLSDMDRLDYSLSELQKYLLSEKAVKDMQFFFFGTKKDLVLNQDIYDAIEQKLAILMKDYKWQIKYISIYQKQQVMRDFQEISDILTENNKP